MAKVVGEVPSGAMPGTSFTLANTPTANSEALYHNGLRIKRVGALTDDNQYTIAGAAIVTFTTVASGDDLQADYLF